MPTDKNTVLGIKKISFKRKLSSPQFGDKLMVKAHFKNFAASSKLSFSWHILALPSISMGELLGIFFLPTID